MKQSGSEVADWMVQKKLKQKKKNKSKDTKQPDRKSIAPEMKHHEFLKKKQK